MESVIEGRKTLICMHIANKEFVTTLGQGEENVSEDELNGPEDRFVLINAKRYMEIIRSANGNMAVGFGDVPLNLNLGHISKYEIVDATTDRWKETQAIYEMWKNPPQPTNVPPQPEIILPNRKIAR